MQIAELISLSKSLAYAADAQASDSDVLLGLNITYQDMRQAVLRACPDFDTLTWEATFEAGRTAYGVPEDTALMLGTRMVRRVETSYGADSGMSHAREVSVAMWRDKESLKDWSFGDCVWALEGNILHVGPAPVQDVGNGLRIIGTPNVASLTSETTENDIRLPKTYHRLMALGAAGYLFARRWMIAEKERIRAEYEQEKVQMIADMRNRGEEVVEISLPPLFS